MRSTEPARVVEHDLNTLWAPRDYQKPLYRYLRKGGKRAVAVWHRRAGKDSTSLHWTVEAALSRVGTYWHMLPTLRQGRKVIWEGITADGMRVLDAFPGWNRDGDPEGLVKHIRHDEMKIELWNNSVWQVVGADNYDALMGANPVGVVFSEWSLTNPAAWEYIRPILAENGGWALFIYTPRGRNHGYRTFKLAGENEGWYSQILTVDDTKAISLAAIGEDRKSGMPEEIVQQEYYCSFEAATRGAYYGKLIATARTEGRICGVPYDPAASVYTAWDLGIGDPTAIWFLQMIGKEVHWIDYYEASGEALDHYAALVKSKPYVYEDHLIPHDGAARELGTGKTRQEQLQGLGLRTTIVQRQSVEDGINAVRMIIPRSWFDSKKCERGIDALSLYRSEFDEEKQTFGDRPVHDWTSHGSDAARTAAMGLKPREQFQPIKYPKGHVSRHVI